MRLKVLENSGGFTYLAALMLVVIMGIMLGVVGESMYMVTKREREEELFFRGGQMQDAIERWYTARGRQSTPLRDLEHLLKDPRSPAVVRYLRRPYKDPMTDKDWVKIEDPNKGILGVRSSSDQEPAKQAEFPTKWKHFEGKTKYSEWLFVYGQTPQQGSVKGIRTMTPSPVGSPTP